MLAPTAGWHGLLGGPNPRLFNFASTKRLSICEFLLALFLSHEISVSHWSQVTTCKPISISLGTLDMS